MATMKLNEFQPDYFTPPGDVIGEWLEEKKMTQVQLALRLGLSAKTLNLIIKSKAALSHATALKLERVTGISANFWNSMEALYQEYRLRQEEDKSLEQDFKLLDKLPISYLRKKEIVKAKPNDQLGVLKEVLSFFQVANADSWDALWAEPFAAFRKSSVYESKIGALATWMRLGEISAGNLDLVTFNALLLQECLPKLRQATIYPEPEVFLPMVVELLEKAGVALVLIPEITGSHCSGVTRWVGERPLIQLSLRHKTDDHLWFTLFHEIGHVLLHPRNSTYLVSMDLDRQKSISLENQANLFAEDTLIPRETLQTLKTLQTLESIKKFAENIGVSPGIVVGRMQKESFIGYAFGNSLKRRYKFVER